MSSVSAATRSRIAVVGSGIAGLSAAWLLSQKHTVTVFEAGDWLGGHTHTVDVTLEGITHGVDTGFLVFNRQTYLHLVPMFEYLQIPMADSEMTFSLALESPDLQWSGTSLRTLFAQRRNLFRPGFLRMLRDILRFNREAAAYAQHDAALNTTNETLTLGAFLQQGRYSAEFRDWYLGPMSAAIWSCPTQVMLDYPFPAFARFFHNHGLLRIAQRPPWYTVRGGARQYVDKLAHAIVQAGGEIQRATRVNQVERFAHGVQLVSQHTAENASTASKTHSFDALVLACHSDEALRILGAGATQAEQRVLKGIGWQSNRAILHTDTQLLPSDPRVWSAWNYTAGHDTPNGRAVAVHYLINKLQPLPFRTPVIVSLNPHRLPAPEKILGDYAYAHPMFGHGASAAQAELPQLQGQQRTWFCGAWTGHGFHEDGLRSALTVAASFGIDAPWQRHASTTLRAAA